MTHKPAKGALDHPTMRQHFESLRIIGAFHDFDFQVRPDAFYPFCEVRAGITAVHPEQAPPRKPCQGVPVPRVNPYLGSFYSLLWTESIVRSWPCHGRYGCSFLEQFTTGPFRYPGQSHPRFLTQALKPIPIPTEAHPRRFLVLPSTLFSEIFSKNIIDNNASLVNYHIRANNKCSRTARLIPSLKQNNLNRPDRRSRQFRCVPGLLS